MRTYFMTLIFAFLSVSSSAAPAVGKYKLADPYKVDQGTFPYEGKSCSEVAAGDKVSFLEALGAKDTPFPAAFNPVSDDVCNIRRGCVGYTTFVLGYGPRKMPHTIPGAECYDNPISAAEQLVKRLNANEADGLKLRIVAVQHNTDTPIRKVGGKPCEVDPTKINVGPGYHFAIFHQEAVGAGDSVITGWSYLWGSNGTANTLSGAVDGLSLYYRCDLKETGVGKKYRQTTYCLVPQGSENGAAATNHRMTKMEPTKAKNLITIPPGSTSGYRPDGRGGYRYQFCTEEEAAKILEDACKEVTGATFEIDAVRKEGVCRCGDLNIFAAGVPDSDWVQCSAVQIKAKCTESIAAKNAPKLPADKVVDQIE